ncbi:hypothetical protein BASA81_000891 [Batrachochytrium salamandrivorans]|nr:hypothetical protein BASA81_000891 [Batrachochytrium salamandrivorans]
MLSNFRSYLKSSSPFTDKRDLAFQSEAEQEAWRPSSGSESIPDFPRFSSPAPSAPAPSASSVPVKPKRKIAVISTAPSNASPSPYSADLEHVFGKPSAHQQDLFVVDNSTIRLVSVPKRPPRPLPSSSSFSNTAAAAGAFGSDPTFYLIRPPQPLFVAPNNSYPLPQPPARPRSFELEEQRRQRVIAATLERMHQVSVSSSASTQLPTPPKRPSRLPASSRSSPPTAQQQVFVSVHDSTPLPQVKARPRSDVASSPLTGKNLSLPGNLKQTVQSAFRPVTSKFDTENRPRQSSSATRKSRDHEEDDEEELSDFSDHELSPAFETLRPSHYNNLSPPPFAVPSNAEPFPNASRVFSPPDQSKPMPPSQQQTKLFSPPTQSKPMPPTQQPPPPPLQQLPKRFSPSPQPKSQPSFVAQSKPMSPPVMPPPRPPPEPPATTTNTQPHVSKRSESEQRLANKCQDLLDRGKIHDLLSSCDEWKRLNPMGAKDAFLFAGRAYLLRGEVSHAEHNFKTYLGMGGQDCATEQAKLHKLQGYREFCLQELGKRTSANNKTNTKFAKKMCEICPYSPQLFLLKAAISLTAQEGEFQLDVAQAISLSSEQDHNLQILRPSMQYARVLHRVGLTQEADLLLDEVCTKVPHSKTCQDLLRLFRTMESAKSDANEAYLQGNLDLAVEMNSKALLLDASNDLYNAVVYSNRAACYMQRGDYLLAVDDCDAALRLSPSFLRARLRRGRSLLKLHRYRECIADFELALRGAGNSDSVAQELAEARLAYKEYQEHRFSGQRRSAKPPPPSSSASTSKHVKIDLYQVLGVTPQASHADIKKAYHKAALKHHPDKNIGDDTAAQRFKGVLEAFNTLKDPTMRKKYDLSTSSAIGVPMM